MALIFIDYIAWYFLVAPRDIASIAGNYIRSSWVAFMIPGHLKTLFSPWHRRDPSQLLDVNERTMVDKVLYVIADFYIRLIAAALRSVIIVTGLLWQILLSCFFFTLIVAWLIWPVIAIILFIKGFFLAYPNL
jgi:hypothetical protein